MTSPHPSQRPHPLTPRPYGQHPICSWCQKQMGEEHVVHEATHGQMQVFAGEDALDIVDVLYSCPCGTLHVVRFKR